MQKRWIKNADFDYSLLIDEIESGRMAIQFQTIGNNATFNIGESEFKLNRTGFWKSTIEITDAAGRIILKTYPEKWYANSSIIDFEDKKYQLVIRNNPMAEFVIKENDQDMLAYGLDSEDGKLKVRITTSKESNMILDFLLWYLFVPIANENFGESYLFLLSQTT